MTTIKYGMSFNFSQIPPLTVDAEVTEKSMYNLVSTLVITTTIKAWMSSNFD